MMRNAIRLMRMLTGWVLVASMLVCSSSGMVLCVGDDGHLAVEPAHDGHHDLPVHEKTGQTHHDGDHPAPISAGNDSGGCLDLPLDLDKLSQVVKDLKPGHLPKGVFLRDSASGYIGELYAAGHRSHFLAGRDQSNLPQFLLVHRTTVMRL